MISKGFGVVAFFASVKASSVSAVWQVALLLYRLSYRGSTATSGCFILRTVTNPFQFDVHFATDVLIRKEKHFLV